MTKKRNTCIMFYFVFSVMLINKIIRRLRVENAYRGLISN